MMKCRPSVQVLNSTLPVHLIFWNVFFIEAEVPTVQPVAATPRHNDFFSWGTKWCTKWMAKTTKHTTGRKRHRPLSPHNFWFGGNGGRTSAARWQEGPHRAQISGTAEVQHVQIQTDNVNDHLSKAAGLFKSDTSTFLWVFWVYIGRKPFVWMFFFFCFNPQAGNKWCYPRRQYRGEGLAPIHFEATHHRQHLKDGQQLPQVSLRFVETCLNWAKKIWTDILTTLQFWAFNVSNQYIFETVVSNKMAVRGIRSRRSSARAALIPRWQWGTAWAACLRRGSNS